MPVFSFGTGSSLDMNALHFYTTAMLESLALSTAAQLKSASSRLEKMKTVVGFDGFVDTILQVVKTRQSPTKYTAYAKMSEWAERVAAAAGVSANFEFTQQMVKLGGNGPIMANALDAAGLGVTSAISESPRCIRCSMISRSARR